MAIGEELPRAHARAGPRRIVTTSLALAAAVLLIAALFAVGARRHREIASGPRDVRALLEQTQEVRELRAREPIVPELLSGAEMSEAVRSEVEEELVTGLPSETVLHTLQVLPEAADLEEVLIEGSVSAVLGFYDPDTKRLVVESQAGPDLTPLAQTTLVHELTHAITDQHFDLGRLVEGDVSGDRLSASLALIEGDAMLAMGNWARDHLTLSDQLEAGFEAGIAAVGGSSPDAPPAISEVQTAPYIHGLAFVRALHDRGGWAAVDAAYRDPPQTTEQILHPEKYAAGELGERVAPPAAPAGAERVESGTLGELFTRAWLSGGAGAVIPGLGSGPASGWDGDAYTSWVDGRGTNFASVGRWDTPEDAREYRAAVVRWFESHFGTADPAGDRLLAGGRCLLIAVDGTTSTMELNSSGCYE